MKATKNPILHELAVSLRFIGLRDRLRCPKCNAVGTWKPHGGVIDGIYDMFHGEFETRLVRRWLCKWCGHYVGPEGTLKAYVDQEKNVWALPNKSANVGQVKPLDYYKFTPADVVREKMGKVWPWRG